MVILEGGGYKFRGELFQPTNILVFAMIIVFLTFLGLGVKFSRWIKLTRWGKIHQVGTNETDIRYLGSYC